MSVAALDAGKFRQSISHNLTVLDIGARFRGGIDHMRNGIISGWVMDLLHRHTTIRVTLWMGDINVIETEASLFRSDISNYIENNRCGFWLDLNRLDYKTITRVLASEAVNAKPFVDPFGIRLRVGTTDVNIDLHDYGITDANFRSQLLYTQTLLGMEIENKKIVLAGRSMIRLPSCADAELSAESPSLAPSEISAKAIFETCDAPKLSAQLVEPFVDDSFPPFSPNIIKFPPTSIKVIPPSIPLKISIVTIKPASFH